MFWSFRQPYTALAVAELGRPNRKPRRILGFPSFRLKLSDVFRERGKEGSARERKGFRKNEFFFYLLAFYTKAETLRFAALNHDGSALPPVCDPDPGSSLTHLGRLTPLAQLAFFGPGP